MAKVLGRRRQAEGFVFLAPDGQPWTADGPARESLTAAYDTAGLREAGRLWHTLRHTSASALANGGLRRDVVESLMGHNRQGTTSIYTHLFADAFDGVEEALHLAFAEPLTSTTRQQDAVSPPVGTDHHQQEDEAECLEQSGS